MSSFAVPFEEDERDPNVWFVDHNYIEFAPRAPAGTPAPAVGCSVYADLRAGRSTASAAKLMRVRESSDGQYSSRCL